MIEPLGRSFTVIGAERIPHYGLWNKHFTESGLDIAFANRLVLPQHAKLVAACLLRPKDEVAIPGDAARAKVIVLAYGRIQVAARITLDFDAHTASRMQGGVEIGPQRPDKTIGIGVINPLKSNWRDGTVICRSVIDVKAVGIVVDPDSFQVGKGRGGGGGGRCGGVRC